MSQEPEKTGEIEITATVETQTEKAKETGGVEEQKALAIYEAKHTWRWDHLKRKAVTMTAQGLSVRQISNKLREQYGKRFKGNKGGPHYTTVQRWRGNQEFQAAVMAELREITTTRRLKRQHETAVFTDQLSVQLSRNFKKLNESVVLTPREMQDLNEFMRQYRAFRAEERVDMGDDARSKGMGNVNVNIGIGSQQSAALGGVGAQSFKAFVEAHADKVVRRSVLDVATPQEALVGIAEGLAIDTDILEEIFVEEVEAEGQKR